MRSLLLLPCLLACASTAPPPAHAAPEPAPTAIFRCEISGAWIEGDGQSDEEAGYGEGFTSSAEATSDQSQADACARARRDVCPDVPSCFLRIDGVAFIEVRELARGREPHYPPIVTPRDEEWTCEVELEITVASTEASAQGADGAAARAAARVEGCLALGSTEGECADPERFVSTLRSSTHAPGGSTATMLVSERAVRSGSARSGESKLEACRAAVAEACANQACGEDAVLLVFDGLPAPSRF